MASKFVLTAEISLRPPTNMKAVRNQIIAGLRGVQVPIDVKVDPKQVQKAVKSVDVITRSTERAIKSADELGIRVSRAIRRIATYTVGATLFYGIIREIRTAVGETIEFQNELVKLKQITGQSFSSLKNITGEISNLSVSLGVSSRKLIDVAGAFAQAGYSAKETRSALAAIAKSDVSPTFENMMATTQASIAVTEQFNMEIKDLEKTLSSINSVSAKFAVESGEITAAVKRAGGAFKVASGTFNEFQSLFTSVSSTTRESAETIATSFKTIFARLQRTDIQQFLRDFGVELTYVTGEAEALGKTVGNFVGPYEAVRRLNAALKDMDNTDPRFAQIMKEIGGDRHLSKLIPLIQEFAKSEQALNIAMASTNSLNEDAATSMASFTRQITSAREELMAMLRGMTDSQGFKMIVTGLLDVSRAVIRVVDSLKPMLPAIGALLTMTAIRGGKPFMSAMMGDLKKGIGFASGGIVPGQGNGDTVPAMLTPGEFVLNKKAVKRVGLSNLQHVNAQKFAKGGLVGNAFGGEGGLPNLFIVSALASSFVGLDSSLGKVISTVGQVVTQFGILKFVLSSVNSLNKNKGYFSVTNPLAASAKKKRDEETKLLHGNIDRYNTIDEGLEKNRRAFTFAKKMYQSRVESYKKFAAQKRKVEQVKKANNWSGTENDLYDDITNTKGVISSTIGLIHKAKAARDDEIRNGGNRKYKAHLAAGLAGPKRMYGPDQGRINKIDKYIEYHQKRLSVQEGALSRLGNVASVMNAFPEENINKGLDRAKSGATHWMDRMKQIKQKVNPRLEMMAGFQQKINQGRNFLQKNKQLLRNRIKDIKISTPQVTNAVGITGAIGAVGGGYLSSLAEGNLQGLRTGAGGSASSAKTQGAIGGALQYGGSGAVLGAGIGALAGPIGMAVGAAVGGIAGGIYGWTTEAHRIQQEIEKIQFGQKFDELTTTLGNIFSGKTTGLSGAGGVKSGISAYLGQLQTVNDMDRRTDLVAQGKDLVGALPAFFQSIAGGVKNLEEFKQIVGKDTINVFTMLTNKTMKQFDKEMENQISLTQRKIKIDEASIKAAQEMTRQLEFQRSIGGAVDDAALAVSKGGIGDHIAAIRRKGSVTNSGLVADSIMKVGRIFGDSGIKMGGNVTSAMNLKNTLPGLLSHIAAGDPLGQGDNFTNKLRQGLAGNPKHLVDMVISQVEKMRAGSESDAEIIKGIHTNVQSVVDDITGPFADVFESLAEAGEKFAGQFNNFISSMEQISGKNMGIANLASGSYDIASARSRFNSMARGDLHANFNELNSIASNKISNMGLGATTVGQMSAGLMNADARAFSLQEMLNRGSTDANVVRELANARTESERYAEALRMVADTSNGLISVEEERLSYMRDQRQKRAGWNEQYLGGSDMDRFNMLQVAQTAKMVSGGMDFNNVRSDMRGGVLNYLKDFDQETFNKLTGNVASDEEKKQAEVVDKLYAAAAEAQNALTNFAQNDLTRFITDLDNSFNKFLSELSANQLQAQANTDAQKANLTNLDLAKAKAISEDKARLSALSGGLDLNSLRANFDTVKGLNANSNINKNILDETTAIYSSAAGDVGGTGQLKTFLEAVKNEMDYLKSTNIFTEDELAKLEQKITNNAGQYKDWSGTYRYGRIAGTIKDELGAKEFNLNNSERANNEFRATSGVTGTQMQAIQQNQLEIAKILERLNKNPEMHASGGFVGGIGNKDSVHAMLTPGEFVVRKSVAQKFGSTLQALNNGQVQAFANGGSVGSTISTGNLDASMLTFSANIEKLSQAFASFPSEISLTAYHKVDVVFNGAQVFESFKPEMKAIAIASTKQAINKMLRIKFPEVGQITDSDL